MLKIRFLCQNCNCIVDINVKHDYMHLIIKEFKEKTGVALCTLVDNKGYIVVSEADENIPKLKEKKLINFYRALRKLASKHSNIINFKSRVEVFSLIQKFDPALKDYMLIVKAVNDDEALISLVPNKLRLTKIIPKFERTIEKLSQTFINNQLVHPHI